MKAMKKAMISLATENGKVEVEALVSGEFAVHRRLGQHSRLLPPHNADWVVTHVRTGRAAPYSFPRQKDAVCAMKELLLLDVDWSLPFRKLNTRAVGKRVEEAIARAKENS